MAAFSRLECVEKMPFTARMKWIRWCQICRLFAVVAWALFLLACAGWFRFADLAASPVKTDEMMFVLESANNAPLDFIWQGRKEFVQPPLADAALLAWMRVSGRIFPAAASETPSHFETDILKYTRMPFAMAGFLTVWVCAGWVWRRRGFWPALLLLAWMGILPFHVYFSREAGHAVWSMLFAALLFFRTLDGATALRRAERLPVWRYLEWGVWFLAACLSYSYGWAFAFWMWVLMLWASIGIGPCVRRWWRGGCLILILILTVAACCPWSTALSAFSASSGFSPAWILLRMLPLFLAGVNVWGVLWLLLAMAACYGMVRKSAGGGRGFTRTEFGFLTVAVWGGILFSSLALVFHRDGRFAVVAPVLPVFLVWAVMSLDAYALRGGCMVRRYGLLALSVVLVFILWRPALQVVRLEGNPVPYRKIQAWLNFSALPCDVTVLGVQSNEERVLPLYELKQSILKPVLTTSNSEEDFRTQVQELFGANRAQFLLALHPPESADGDGAWKWTHQWFARTATVTNEPGMWLRKRGFAPSEEFYRPESRNSLVASFRYNTRGDAVVRARKSGTPVLWFYEKGWQHVPLEENPFGDFDAWCFETNATLEVYNLTDRTMTTQCRVAAFALGGAKTLHSVGSAPLVFPAQEWVEKSFAVSLMPGFNRVEWSSPPLSRPVLLMMKDISFDPVMPPRKEAP